MPPRLDAPRLYCPEMAAKGLCSADACGGNVKARGLCRKHYLWGMRHGVVPPKKPARAVTQHPFDPSLALVALTKGLFATVSAVDAAEIAKSNWSAVEHKSGIVYAQSNRPGPDGVTGRVSLHRLVGSLMGLALANDVDHENGNGLDCRRSNLRDATKQQNAHNARLRRDNVSGVKGVSWNSRLKQWVAQIQVDGRTEYLGVFRAIEEATNAVRVAREAFHGEFANHGEN